MKRRRAARLFRVRPPHGPSTSLEKILGEIDLGEWFVSLRVRTWIRVANFLAEDSRYLRILSMRPLTLFINVLR